MHFKMNTSIFKVFSSRCPLRTIQWKENNKNVIKYWNEKSTKGRHDILNICRCHLRTYSYCNEHNYCCCRSNHGTTVWHVCDICASRNHQSVEPLYTHTHTHQPSENWTPHVCSWAVWMSHFECSDLTFTSNQLLPLLISSLLNDQTHPQVQEDTEEGKRGKEAAGQCPQQPGLLLGWHHLPVPFSAGRTELQHSYRVEQNKTCTLHRRPMASRVGLRPVFLSSPTSLPTLLRSSYDCGRGLRARQCVAMVIYFSQDQGVCNLWFARHTWLLHPLQWWWY